MIASRLDSALALAALLLAASALTACLAPAGTPGGELLERDLAFSARVPDVADYTARDLAAGALASQPELLLPPALEPPLFGTLGATGPGSPLAATLCGACLFFAVRSSPPAVRTAALVRCAGPGATRWRRR